MGVVGDAVTVPLEPARAFELWTDVRRWPTFIDGFAQVERIDGAWPAAGAKLVWRSGPAGRGVVTERVKASTAGALLVTQVFEERMTAQQSVAFTPEGDRTVVAMRLDYEVTTGGPLKGVTDALFIRRAQRDAVRRTLDRFAIEAAEEAAL